MATVAIRISSILVVNVTSYSLNSRSAKFRHGIIIIYIHNQLQLIADCNLSIYHVIILFEIAK